MKKITFLFLMFLVSFTGFAQFPESFEGATFPPTGWASYEGTNGLGTVESWGVNTDVFNTGLQSAVVFYESGTGGINEDWLVTPAVTITAPNTALSFFQRQAFAPDYGTEYTIRVSTTSQTDIASFTTALTQTEADLSATAFQQIQVDLSAYIGQSIYIAFVMSQDDGDVWAIDDVDFMPSVDAPDCASNPTPVDAATNVPVGTVTLAWDAPTTGGAVDSYNIYFGTDSSALTLLGNIAANTVDITNVNDFNTTFYWQAVSLNAAGEAVGCAVWSFTTEPAPGYCLTAPFNQYPTATFVPATCDGLTDNVIAANCYAGEYSVVTVTAGQTYTFKSGATDFITISDLDGLNPIVYGATPLTWVADVDGDVRFYSHIDDQCGTENVNRTRSVLCGIPGPDSPDYVNLQFPPTITNSGTVYAQVYEPGLTDTTAGQAPGINAWVGISQVGQNTNPNTWTTWIPATFNVEAGNNDEYQAVIGTTQGAGTYYYATRFNLNGGGYVYGGLNNGFWNATTNPSGVLTVNAPANDACSSATSATLPYDATVNAYATTNNGGVITVTDCGGMNDGVWYSFVGDGGDITVDISEVTGAWDPELGIYTGSCGAFVCEGNADIGLNDEGENLVVASTAGTTYYVNVGQFSTLGDNPEGAFRIQISSSLGNGSFDNDTLTLAPNPVKNFLNVSYNETIDTVEVFNLLGQKVASTKLNATQGQVDMSSLASGAYIVKATSNDRVKTMKVIKE
jgi:hypothetical protein